MSGSSQRVTGAQHARQNNQDLTPLVAVPESARARGEIDGIDHHAISLRPVEAQRSAVADTLGTRPLSPVRITQKL